MTRDEQKAATRLRILQSALNTFAERGFEGAGIRQIASDAGVKHGLVGYYFKDKDGLWKAAVEFLFERLHEKMQMSPHESELPAHERSKIWLRRYVRYCAQHPAHARIMVQESIRDSGRLRWAVRKFIKPDHELLKQSFERLVADGIALDIPYHSYIYMFTAAAQSPFLLAAEVRQAHGINVTDEAFIEAHADAVHAVFFSHWHPV
ncbi:MAG: TetR/AcrR family transcriptional regulator [Gammaproteobacteria bacterium]|jgi:TetR/AcrR family transcriptional regulator|nr:TetR/AcrR family transcriptional regulator [Gammaproteobacteria bacterium]MDH5172966.1 TetR/AcrR family transcriptional regulator [Gammaproteobacteria bacterium]